ncbi:integral membrane protein [Colletotrichum scovillei]|uniref:Integral membrane protein n=1 Tax=Colletotrichum scovillei TaxID=1209932 RepID=A0A9P7UF15_9PEZI|nr:integral membrane protein [Colletotrichum scovillei]KAG7072601.1 integral membrane protein [Colletotrichum scovillei]KAG7080677.1 integral membrane protein [Colletotrichum scovillei]
MELGPVVSHPASAASGPTSTTAEPVNSTPTKSRSAAIIFSITCITGISNLLAGLLTVCIPVIAADIGIPAGLQLWPASAFALACGCTLLLCATAADLLGCRRVCLLGALLQAGSALGAGLSQTSTQLIALRAFAGVAASMCLPSAAGIVSSAFPHSTRPRTRTAAFSAMGGGQAVGFGLGLALGGVFSGTVGWRWGFHATAILNVVVLAIALWALPVSVDDAAPLGWETLTRLRKELDWIGALIISMSLAFMSYVLGIVTDSDAGKHMRQPLNIVLLGTGVALLPVYVFWMHHQKLRGRPALIPNELWKNEPFTSVCFTVFLVWGALNASEQLTALYLQDVRGFSTLTSSLYFLPAPVCGILTNIAVAVFLSRLRASYAVPVACFVSGLAPLLLAALCRVNGPSYWEAVFQAMAINPIGADMMYTIAMLVVTDAFPAKTQALAGGVFNMVAQIGKSVGIATTAVIAQQVSSPLTKSVGAKEALLRGYHAGWWFSCGLSFISVAVSLWGLRSVGRLGVKRD